MVISIANQKGGVGKTTLAILFSNYLKRDLLVVDFDFQNSFYSTWEQEKEIFSNNPPYEVIKKDLSESNEVAKMVQDIEEQIVLFDLPGKMDDDNLIPIFKVTDILIVPFGYDKISVESTLFFSQLVTHINKNAKLFFIPNRIKNNVKYKTKDQVDELLRKYGSVTAIIKDKICLQRISTYSNNDEITAVVEKSFSEILKHIS